MMASGDQQPWAKIENSNIIIDVKSQPLLVSHETTEAENKKI